MKYMEYYGEILGGAEILAEGKYKGYNYYILFLDTLLTVHIEAVDQDDEFYRMRCRVSDHKKLTVQEIIADVNAVIDVIDMG